LKILDPDGARQISVGVEELGGVPEGALLRHS
jgi:hypothetical protein